jgi:Ran GTPase-activating protein (RanGAP) involved in mRNA processing and transport
LHFHFQKQTLITLDFANNNISDEGAQYLADALKNNTVNMIFFPIPPSYLFFFKQTMTELALAENAIGESGARYLADLLTNNMVNIFLLLSVLVA